MAKKVRLSPKLAPLTVGEADLMVRTNPPASRVADLLSGENDRILAGLGAVVIEHPYVDDDDVPLAPADWDLDTIGEFVEAYGALLTALPKASGTRSGARS